MFISQVTTVTVCWPCSRTTGAVTITMSCFLGISCGTTWEKSSVTTARQVCRFAALLFVKQHVLLFCRVFIRCNLLTCRSLQFRIWQCKKFISISDILAFYIICTLLYAVFLLLVSIIIWPICVICSMTPYLKVSLQQFFSTNGNQVFYFGNEYLILIITGYTCHLVWVSVRIYQSIFQLFAKWE